MAQASMDQPVVWGPSAGHRPMSLLLQALRQIESKAPACFPTTSEPQPCLEPVITTPAPVETSIESSDNAHGKAPPADSATPAQRLLAESLLTHLRPADRVLALFNVEPLAMARPLADHVAAGLAAHADRDVLLIQQVTSAESRLALGGRAVDLADVLEGRIGWHEAADATGHDRVRVLRAREPAADGGMAIGGLRRGWKQALGHYGYVVLDAGSHDASHLPSVLLSCDAAFLVVGLGETDRRRVKRWIELLRRAGVEPRASLVVGSEDPME